MKLRRVCLSLCLIALATAPAARAADELNAALRRLDVAAQKFKAAEADIVWDNVQTEPIEDKDTQLGNAVFERKGGQLSVALHIKSDNGRPYAKEIVYTGGSLSFYEPRQKSMNVYKAGGNRAEFETLLTLGFGGSGRELEKNWVITLGGPEMVNGTSVTRLDLVPRDEALKKNVVKVQLWLDLDRGVAVKQMFYSPDGNYREVTYRDLHLNGSVAPDAFQIKTAPGTVIQNH